MIAKSDEAQKHIPTLTRQWLKDKILLELPTVKSVRQKDRRKPSVLYCPEACEEDYGLFFLNAKSHQRNGKHNDADVLFYLAEK